MCGRVSTDLTARLYLTVLVCKSAGSTDVRAYFSIHRQRVCKKYGNWDVNELAFIASEVEHLQSYRSLTFAYFKPFLGLNYKFVKPVNIDFASKLYGS